MPEGAFSGGFAVSGVGRAQRMGAFTGSAAFPSIGTIPGAALPLFLIVLVIRGSGMKAVASAGFLSCTLTLWRIAAVNRTLVAGTID